jgi:predicted phosphodiesterase
LVDIKRSWELLQKLAKFLERWKRKGVNLYTVLGQHDSYYHDMTNEKTILGVLISSGLVTRLTSCPILVGEYKDVGTHQIYGASYGEEIPEVDGYGKGLKILVVHKQILVKKEFAQQEEYMLASSFLKEHKDFDLILCGDAHQRFEVKQGKRWICNTGVMLRMEASQQMMKHAPGFYVYDTKDNSLKWVGIPHGKASVVMSKEHLEKEKEKKHNFDLFIAKVKESGDEQKSVSFEKNLAMIMKKNKTKDSVKKIVSEYLTGGDK